MNDLTGFKGIAPYLKDPLVLIGFVLLLAFLFSRYLVKQGIIKTLPSTLGYEILKSILLYGFIIAILLIILGFALRYQELASQQQKLGEIAVLLRDVLDHRSSLPEEKKVEIINRVLEAYRSGALSEGQIERLVEEIKVSPAQAGSHISELKPSRNLPSVSDSRGEISPPTSQNSSADSVVQSSTNPIQYGANPPQNAEGRNPPASNDRSPLTLIRPFGLVPQRCDIKITSPHNGTVVNRWAVVSGTAELPANYRVWTLVQYEAGQWKPVESAFVGKNGKWAVSVTFGKSRELGLFNIGVVAADENAISDANKAEIIDATLANLGCSFVTAYVYKQVSDRPPRKIANCGGGRVATCESAYRCDCTENVGCFGYDSNGTRVEVDECPGLDDGTL